MVGSTDPPVHGVTVGQVEPRQPVPRGLLIAVSLALVVMLVSGTVLLALRQWAGATGPEETAELLVFGMILVFISVLGANAWLASQVSGLAARLGADGVLVQAGDQARLVPWRSVPHWWIAGSGSSPTLCLTVDDPARVGFQGVGWRAKLHVNRRLFGTPLAIPLASTGVDEAGLVEVVRRYHGPAGPPPAAPERARRVRGLLQAATVVPVTVLVAAAWAGSVTVILLLRPSGPEDVLLGATAVTFAVAATMAVPIFGGTLFRALVPPRGGAWPRR